jgi:cellulose synthase/poly-beta-1,6-N-acetylglucosamine synthase-like glycosyltransferase
MSSVDLALFFATGILLIPFAVFCLECALALLPRRLPRIDSLANPGEVWIIIPAHNEALVIGATLSRLCPTLLENQQILVVADNCNDNTASIAREQGCQVIERSNSEKRGKGFALQYAFAHLESNHNPSVVIVLDADCRVAPFTISRIASLAHQKNRPVQALNLSHRAKGSQGIHVISELGFRFKNLVRPTGLARLGLPCHLMGTGMAIPWTLLKQCRVAGDHLAEDMNLGIELSLRGHSTLFCPSGQVLSELPQQDSGFISQRTRWEQGHLRTSLALVPTLLFQGIRQRSLNLLSLGFDLTVPPFTLLILCWLAGVFGAAAFWHLGASSLPLLALISTGAITASLILGCWWKFCRHQVPFSSLLFLPIYILRKLPIYASFLFGRSVKQWVRTERQASSTHTGC